jgi:hypothetical protein
MISGLDVLSSGQITESNNLLLIEIKGFRSSSIVYGNSFLFKMI